MKKCVLFFLVFLTCSLSVKLVSAKNEVDRPRYYQVLISNDLPTIEAHLSELHDLPPSESNAFSGALLMKMAGVLKSPGEKLRVFKDGMKKLEMSIKNDSTNTEFRFLRLIIQEHAPAIMRYSTNVEQDKSNIIRNFHHLEPVLKKEIIKYSGSSKALSGSIPVE